MNPPADSLSRRDALKATITSMGLSALAFEPSARAVPAAAPDARRGAVKKYQMLKSINLWAFPYPERMTLRECMQLAKKAGFDGIELNYDLDNDLSPKHGTQDYKAIRKMADEIGIQISGLCSFLFWPYPLTSNDPAKRAQGMELAGKIAQCAHDLGVENVLVVPGAVNIPWRTDHEPVANDVCDQRAREAVGQLAKQAEKLKVCLNIENIFFNGYLMTPMEMNAFVDGIGSEHVRVHFDTGNISMFQFPEHWAKVLGGRTKNVHLKEFTKKGTDFSLETFRPLLDGTTNWPAVTDALADTGYTGFLTFEYFHPYAHYPEALIYQTSDSLDRILGRKSCWETIALLFFAGLSAGFIDAVAGGGGLISVPALLWAGLPPQMALGTNKMQSTWGTLMAVRKYAKAGYVSWPQVRLAVLITFIFACLGAWVVTLVSNEVLKMIVPWMLLGIAVYVLLSPGLGKTAAKARVSLGAFACLAGSVLGFYDGFFGPGTGTFWTMACISLLGLELTRATAFTKVANLTSNMASLIVFVVYGRVNYEIAAAMIAGQLIGGRLGAGMAIRHGAPFIRIIFIAVVFAMVAKLLWDQFA